MAWKPKVTCLRLDGYAHTCFFVSPSLIGIYEVAWGLGSMLAVISTSVRTTLFPEISDLSAQEEEISHYLKEGLTFSGILVVPGFFSSVVEKIFCVSTALSLNRGMVFY